MDEFLKEMQRLGIKDVFEITEFDQSLNDATRREINKLLKRYNNKLFGLKLWDFKIINATELKNIHNFGVNYIFKLEDEEKVKNIIEEYKKKEKELEEQGIPFSAKETWELLNKLEEIAIYSCFWV
jgi:hypothetical protein